MQKRIIERLRQWHDKNKIQKLQKAQISKEEELKLEGLLSEITEGIYAKELSLKKPFQIQDIFNYFMMFIAIGMIMLAYMVIQQGYTMTKNVVNQSAAPFNSIAHTTARAISDLEAKCGLNVSLIKT
jgi:hypothetical protein